MDIIHGKKVEDIDTVMESPNVYYIDESVMEKFDLDKSLIPEDAIVIHHQADFLERNKEVLLPGSLLFLGLGLITCGILIISSRSMTRMDIPQEMTPCGS